MNLQLLYLHIFPVVACFSFRLLNSGSDERIGGENFKISIERKRRSFRGNRVVSESFEFESKIGGLEKVGVIGLEYNGG